MKRATSGSVASSTLVPPIGSITCASGCVEECCQTAILKSTLGLALADDHLLDRAAKPLQIAKIYAALRIDRNGSRRGRPSRQLCQDGNTLSVSNRLHKTYNPDVGAVRVGNAPREIGRGRKNRNENREFL